MRSEIPFNKTPANKLIPWMIAVMVYLITLILGIAVIVNENIRGNQASLNHTLIAEILPASREQQPTYTQEIQRHRAILSDILHLNGVLDAHFVQATSLKSSPAGTSDSHQLLPTLIEIKLDPLKTADLDAVSNMLQETVPDIRVIKEHHLFQEEITYGWMILTGCMTLVTLIGAAAMITIIFATYTGVSLHQWAIDLLQLLGATDDYIAKRFRSHALQLSLKGSGIGSIFAVLTFAAVQYGHGKYPFFLENLPQRAIWATIAITPLFMAVMTLISSRITVLFALNQKDE